ncbi:MAG: TIGR00300 family protein [Candidatus Riflebacteria bacterium]|nr:TIGR00300 family protein [Candidatus Riflebacteria bacterium]
MKTDFSEFPFALEQTVKGHLIDSGIMSAIMNLIIRNGGSYEINEFTIGQTHLEMSFSRFKLYARTESQLKRIQEGLLEFGCQKTAEEQDAILKSSEKDMTVPEDFYSTTNHLTEVKLGGKWYKVENQRMDALIACSKLSEGWKVECRKLREVKKGDMLICGYPGIRIQPEFKERDREEFGFMNSEVSSERRVKIAVSKIAKNLLEKRKRGEKIGVTAGPVVVHTGGGEYLAKLIKDGYIDFLLSGNALAVHDIEQNLYQTSLGIDINLGEPVHEGHKNHMRAINTVFRHGSIKAAIEAGTITGGIMYEITKRNIPFALAGSIRDDGPLPEVHTDMIQAQNAYSKLIQGCGMMLMLSTMLHGIGVGNMLPGYVKTICVDINPAVVTKLADRGSHQTIGIVTDVGSFLLALYNEIKQLEKGQTHS